MLTDYGVRVIVAYENKRVGQVIFPPGIERQLLVRGGFVRAVAPPIPKDEPAAEQDAPPRRASTVVHRRR